MSNWTNKGRKWEAHSGRTYRVRETDDGAWIAEFRGVKASYWLVICRRSSQKAAQDACEAHEAAPREFQHYLPTLVRATVLAILAVLTACGPDPYTTYGNPDAGNSDASGMPSPDSEVSNNNGNNNNQQPGVCGDGIVNLGEECDDGNHDTTDWCPDGPAGTCQFSRCGDGFVQAGMEDCDDGNGINEDLCPDGEYGTCRLAECGDGFVFLGVEQCDTLADPRCHHDCQGRCGDGMVRPGVEECDDYNEQSEDGCSNSCELEDGWDCTIGSPTVCTSICGDGLIVGAEECDDDNLHGQTCASRGFDGGNLSCDGCTFDTTECYLCGDGVCQTAAGEQRNNCPQDCGIIAITAGVGHTCAIRGDHTLWCWGSNGHGILGLGFPDGAIYTPWQTNISDVAAVSSGNDHMCAVKLNGTAWCWGYGEYGQLGNGGVIDQHDPVAVHNLSDVVSISAGRYHTCAVKNDGTAWCWGEKGVLLGGDYPEDQLEPAQVLNLPNVEMIATGNSNTCAAASGGAAWCWGIGGCLGDGTPNGGYTPVQVATLNDVTKIDVSSHTCAIHSDAVWCWGSLNNVGQLGDGTTEGRLSPVQTGLTGVQDLAAHNNAHSCAVQTNGTVWCWGGNPYGQLGDGTTTQRESPVQANNVVDAQHVFVGGQHTCALKTDGTVWCWGFNNRGQLGDGTTDDSFIPVQVQF